MNLFIFLWNDLILSPDAHKHTHTPTHTQYNNKDIPIKCSPGQNLIKGGCVSIWRITLQLLPTMDIISLFFPNRGPCVLTRGHFFAALTPPSVGLETHPSSPCTALESNNVTGKQEWEKWACSLRPSTQHQHWHIIQLGLTLWGGEMASFFLND